MLLFEYSKFKFNSPVGCSSPLTINLTPFPSIIVTLLLYDMLLLSSGTYALTGLPSKYNFNIGLSPHFKPLGNLKVEKPHSSNSNLSKLLSHPLNWTSAFLEPFPHITREICNSGAPPLNETTLNQSRPSSFDALAVEQIKLSKNNVFFILPS